MQDFSVEQVFYCTWFYIRFERQKEVVHVARLLPLKIEKKANLTNTQYLNFMNLEKLQKCYCGLFSDFHRYRLASLRAIKGPVRPNVVEALPSYAGQAQCSLKPLNLYPHKLGPELRRPKQKRIKFQFFFLYCQWELSINPNFSSLSQLWTVNVMQCDIIETRLLQSELA